MGLTDVAIRKRKPAAKTIRITDGQGLYIEITPNGSKLWRFKYRFNGKENRLALGRYPEISLADARRRRDEARKLLANDTDPSAVRKANKAMGENRAADSFEVVAREWYANRLSSWSLSHSSRLLKRLENDVFPWIGKRPIYEIKPPEVLTVLRRIVKRGAVDTAHRIKQDCGQIFRYAVAIGKAERDCPR